MTIATINNIYFEITEGQVIMQYHNEKGLLQESSFHIKNDKMQLQGPPAGSGRSKFLKIDALRKSFYKTIKILYWGRINTQRRLEYV